MTFEQFIKTEATSQQILGFLRFCHENYYCPNDESLSKYFKFTEYNHKITVCTSRLINEDKATEIYFLIKYLIELRDELVSFGESEGRDTETETVRKVNLWIKENIYLQGESDENPNV